VEAQFRVRMQMPAPLGQFLVQFGGQGGDLSQGGPANGSIAEY